MKKTIFITVFLAIFFSGANAQYFQFRVEVVTTSPHQLVLYARPTGTLTNVKPGQFEIFFQRPSSQSVVWGSITNNTTNFPGCNFVENGDDQQGSEPGYITTWFASTPAGTTNKSYVAGTEYEVFRVDITAPGATEFRVCANQVTGVPGYVVVYDANSGGELYETTGTVSPFYGGTITQNGDQFVSTQTLPTALPVNFLSISAKLNADGSRLIKWDVAQEINVKDYTIERSNDGRNFTPIGSVNATGSPSTQTYQFTDAENVSGLKQYYRVRANDMDATKSYSSVVAIRLLDASGIKINPNPVVGSTVMVSFGSQMKGSYSVEIFGSSGALLQRQKVTVSDNETISISRPAAAAKGMYLLRLTRSSDGLANSFKLLFE